MFVYMYVVLINTFCVSYIDQVDFQSSVPSASHYGETSKNKLRIRNLHSAWSCTAFIIIIVYFYICILMQVEFQYVLVRYNIVKSF